MKIFKNWGVLALAICSIAGILLQQNKTVSFGYNDFSLSSIDAYLSDESGSESDTETEGGIKEWWNRKDYVCISVTCQMIVATYKSNYAKKVENGKGTVAHIWNCTGCGNYAFTVDDPETT